MQKISEAEHEGCDIYPDLLAEDPSHDGRHGSQLGEQQSWGVGGHWLKRSGGHVTSRSTSLSMLDLPSIWSVILVAGTASLARGESLHFSSLHKLKLEIEGM